MEKKIDYTSHKGKDDLETLKNIITDIGYLRGCGTHPWQGASSRRRMEKRFSYTEDLTVSGKAVHVVISTSVSCNYVRFGVVASIDGEGKFQYLKALKNLVE